MKNLAASVRARLLNLAQESDQPLDRLMEQYAMGRFLHRLAEGPYRRQFILKGAQLFRIWGAADHRPTRDLDLLGRGEASADAIQSIFTELIEKPGEPEDGLKWGVVRTSLIRDDLAYGGVRAVLGVHLANARLSLQVDVGFGDAVTPAAQEADWHELLDFPAARLLVYPPETVIAEKLEAMVRLGFGNSRMKDFFDLHWLATHIDLDQVMVQEAIENTFARRQTELPAVSPVAYSPAFYEAAPKVTQWNAFLRKNKLQAPGLPEIIKTIQAHFPLPL